MVERMRIHDALLGAYRRHLSGVLERRGIEVSGRVDRAIDRGEAWLAERLEELARTPFHRQRTGPLQLFQAAMRFPTDALHEEGHPPVRRDQVTVNALPGDVYDLAPASSRDLGDEVWAAHLEWGAAKAAAIGPPTH